MKKIGAVLFVVLISMTAVPAGAQQFGTLMGTIVDDSKQPIPGVSVTLTGPVLQGSRTAETEADGSFRFTPIPPGKDYKITCVLEGFQTAVKSGIGVSLNAESKMGQVEMKLGDVTETVNVTGKAVAVDTTKSSIDSNVDWGLIDTLATNRSFQTIMSMAPGTQVSANPYSPVNNPKVHGSDDDDNLYLINGFNQTDPRSLTWGNAINYDTIAEVQLQTAGFEAEFGRTAGGVINLVTKSGGNEVHGTLRYVQASRNYQKSPGTYSYCDPTNVFCEEDGARVDNPKHGDVTTTEKRPEATIGGFILKDSLWYYLSYERRNREQDFARLEPGPCTTTGDQTIYDCLNAKNDTSDYAGHYLSGKLTYQINPSHTLVGYYNTDPIDISNVFGRYYGDFFSESTEVIQKQGGYLASLGLTSIFGQSTFTDLKLSNYDAPLDNVPQHPSTTPTYYDINQGYLFGGALYDYRSIRQNQDLNLSVSQFVDNLLGSHSFKGGVEYLKTKTTESVVYYPNGLAYGNSFIDYNHPEQDVFLTAKVLQCPNGQDGPGCINGVFDNVHKANYAAFYLQDKWQVKGFTFNLGVRLETLDIKNNQDKTVHKFGFGDRIMPRAGFAYDLTNTGLEWLAGSAVHGSWSRFRQFVSSLLGDNFDVLPGYAIYYYEPDYVTPSGDDPYPLAGAAVLDRKIRVPYVDEWTLGYEQKLGKTASIGFNYINRKYLDGIVFKNPNEEDFSLVTNLDFPNTKYDALEVTLKKAFAEDRLQFLASYTHSFHNEGLASYSAKGATFAGPGGYGTCAPEFCDKGRQTQLDSPNLIKFNGSYNYPWGVAGTTTLGVSDYYYSGAVWGAYTVKLHNGSYIVVPDTELGDRNVGSWNRLDLHLEHQVKVDKWGGLGFSIYGDIFNVLNRQSALNRIGYRGYDLSPEDPPTNPYYGYPTRFQNPRVYQWGVKLEF